MSRGIAGAAIARARHFVFLPAVISLTLAFSGCAPDTGIYAVDPEQRELKMSNKAGGEAGGTLTFYAPSISLGSQRSAETRPFVRTGVLGSFSNERSASFQNLGGTIANGTTATSHSWTVPIMAGLSIPATSFGLNVPGLTAEVFAGAHVTRRKSSLFLTEALAPGGPPTSGSTSWTSFDPSVGAALMYQVGNVGARPVTVGPSVTVGWTRAHEFRVPSPNFPAVQTYIVTNRSHTETRLMLNVNVAVNSMMTAGASGGLTW